MEIITITWYDSYKNGYNSALGGRGRFGYKTSDETKRKLSKAGKARKLSDETKRKISQTKYGIRVPNLSGSKNPKSKLTWDEVREIRSKYVPLDYSLSMLAREYSVSRSAIHKIICNKTWTE